LIVQSPELYPKTKQTSFSAHSVYKSSVDPILA